MTPVFTALGDLNGDGFRDLVVANSASNSVSVFAGNGNGTFAPATTYSVGNRPVWTGLGDLDGDGDLDIVVSNFGSMTTPPSRGDTVGILLNTGTGTFSLHRAYVSGRASAGATIVDLDADGRLDIAAGNPTGNTLTVLLARCVR